MTTLSMTPEMRAAVSEAGGAPVLVQDAGGEERFFLVSARSAGALFQEWLRQEFEVGLASVDAGRVGPLDMEAIKARGRDLLAEEVVGQRRARGIMGAFGGGGLFVVFCGDRGDDSQLDF